MSRIALVLAMADDGTIGARGSIPWRIPDDMRHFKALTVGKPCIMGRKTWESLPRKPLPARTNIVVTRDTGFAGEGADVAHTLEAAFARAEREKADEIAVIGGAQIYAAALARADVIHLTEVHAAFSGDTRMTLDRNGWSETARENHVAPDGLRYSFVTLVRQRQ